MYANEMAGRWGTIHYILVGARLALEVQGMVMMLHTASRR
jgi:hypothetical protein